MLMVTRYHDFSIGHRVVGHEGNCVQLHGHNVRVTFYVCAPEQDAVGRVIDFRVIKTHLCDWLEKHWDHRMLLDVDDPMLALLRDAAKLSTAGPGDRRLAGDELLASLQPFPGNPTSENITKFLLHVLGPDQLFGTGCTLVGVKFEETRKCGVEMWLPGYHGINDNSQ